MCYNFFHRHRKNQYVNSNYGYGTGAAPGTYASSDQETGYNDNYGTRDDFQNNGSTYSAGNDYQNSSGYNAGSANQTGSGYNGDNGYRAGSGYNAGNDYRTGSGYNAGGDYQKGYNAGKDHQAGYNAGSGYEQNQSGDNYGRVQHDDTRMEHLGELGGMAAGGHALYENHGVRTDQEHARRHRIEEEVAAAGAAAGAGLALHEHRQKKALQEVSSGRKNHRRFF